jgi:hypothetical protein
VGSNGSSSSTVCLRAWLLVKDPAPALSPEDVKVLAPEILPPSDSFIHRGASTRYVGERDWIDEKGKISGASTFTSSGDRAGAGSFTSSHARRQTVEEDEPFEPTNIPPTIPLVPPTIPRVNAPQAETGSASPAMFMLPGASGVATPGTLPPSAALSFTQSNLPEPTRTLPPTAVTTASLLSAGSTIDASRPFTWTPSSQSGTPVAGGTASPRLPAQIMFSKDAKSGSSWEASVTQSLTPPGSQRIPGSLTPPGSRAHLHRAP